MRPIRHLVAAMALAVGIGACSLPTDDEAALIDTRALPEVLRGDAQVTTTIDPGPLTEPVEIFLLRNDGDRTVVVPVARELDPFAGFEQEIGLLFRGPGVPDIRTEEEVEFGWFSALSDFQLTEAFVNENQVAIIDIVAVDDDGEPIEVPAEALRDAIAQLVYTATGLPEDDAVRAVRIRIDGQAATLPTEGGDSEEVLDRSDFETYDPDFVPPVATAPPTTTTPDPDAGDGDS